MGKSDQINDLQSSGQAIQWYWVPTGFLLFFLLLFLQFPVSGSLPGDVDTWFYVSWFNDALQRLAHFISGTTDYYYLYPDVGAYLQSEPSFGSVAMYGIIKLFLHSDLWAYYFFIVLVFTTNAWATYWLGRKLELNLWAAVLAAMIMSACNFSFALMDNQNAIVFAPMILAFAQIVQFLNTGRQKHLYLLALWGGLQIFFSSYIFIYTVTIAIIWMLWNWRIWLNKEHMLAVLKGALLAVVIISPYIYFYILSNNLHEPQDLTIKLKSLEYLSLEPRHFIQPLKNNLIYGRLAEDKNYYGFTFNAASIGLLAYVLAILGLLYKPKYRWPLVITWLVGFFVAIGPYIYWGDSKIPMPLYFVTLVAQKLILVNHTARFYAICVLIVGLLAGYGLMWLNQRLKVKPVWLFVGVLVVFLLENVPVPFEKFDSARYMKPEPDYTQWMGTVSGDVVLNLPSGPALDNLKEYAAFGKREYIYCYWQLPFDVNVTNGFGRPTQDLKRFRHWAARIDRDDDIDSLLNAVPIDWIAYHPNMLMEGVEDDIRPFLDTTSRLKPVLISDDLVIYQVKH